MRHFEAKNWLRTALFATLTYSAIGCGSDNNPGPPIGAPGPTGPVVVGESGGSAGAPGTGQGTAASGGDTTGLNGTAGSGTDPFTNGTAGNTGTGLPGAGGSGSGSLPPFGAAGSTTFGLGGTGF